MLIRHDGTAEGCANARLIAAVPSLLAAAKAGLVALTLPGQPIKEAHDLLREAIKLAEIQVETVGVIFCGVPPATPHPTEFSADGKTCPKCGHESVCHGYGLAGGGMGTYEACDDCDWFAKQQDPEDES